MICPTLSLLALLLAAPGLRRLARDALVAVILVVWLAGACVTVAMIWWDGRVRRDRNDRGA